MSAVAIKGWCPGALRPMQSGDGLVVRIRPRGGRLDAAQAAGIAELAARYGNGPDRSDQPRQSPDPRRQR
ncbi:sulfite reductase beta subunit-like hemoprotein [Bradyrhizobium sp. JR6.1]